MRPSALSLASQGVFERTVEQTIQETRPIPERMAIDGKIRLTRRTITKRIGQVHAARHARARVLVRARVLAPSFLRHLSSLTACLRHALESGGALLTRA